MITSQVEIFAQIGTGMRLRIPHDGSQPSMIEGLKHAYKGAPKSRMPKWREPIPVDRGVALQAARQPNMLRIPKDTEHYGNSYRTGWLEEGFDGENADFYCMAV